MSGAVAAAATFSHNFKIQDERASSSFASSLSAGFLPRWKSKSANHSNSLSLSLSLYVSLSLSASLSLSLPLFLSLFLPHYLSLPFSSMSSYCSSVRWRPFSTPSLFGLAGGASTHSRGDSGERVDLTNDRTNERANEGGLLRLGCCGRRSFLVHLFARVAADFLYSVSLPPLERNLGGASHDTTTAWPTDCLPACLPAWLSQGPDSGIA